MVCYNFPLPLSKLFVVGKGHQVVRAGKNHYMTSEWGCRY
jgi:hypothetical protein